MSYKDKNLKLKVSRQWGCYSVIDVSCYCSSYKSLTKHLTFQPQKSISYQLHNYRDEVWVVTKGNAYIVIENDISRIKKGDVIKIPKLVRHSVYAIDELHIIETQMGSLLSEEDIERFDFNWDDKLRVV